MRRLQFRQCADGLQHLAGRPGPNGRDCAVNKVLQVVAQRFRPFRFPCRSFRMNSARVARVYWTPDSGAVAPPGAGSDVHPSHGASGCADAAERAGVPTSRHRP